MYKRPYIVEGDVLIFKDVHYTKTFQASVLAFSTIFLVFLVAAFSVVFLRLDTVLAVILSSILSWASFYIINKKKVLRTAEFKLSSDKLEWDKHCVHFKHIDHFKIYWGNGASFRLKLKTGQKINLMSTRVFCKDTVGFSNLCIELNSLLNTYDPGLKEKTFSEYKIYTPLLYSLILLAFILIIYRHFRPYFVLHELVIVLLGWIVVVVSFWKKR